jgi:hypothetical protein
MPSRLALKASPPGERLLSMGGMGGGLVVEWGQTIIQVSENPKLLGAKRLERP